MQREGKQGANGLSHTYLDRERVQTVNVKVNNEMMKGAKPVQLLG